MAKQEYSAIAGLRRTDCGVPRTSNEISFGITPASRSVFCVSLWPIVSERMAAQAFVTVRSADESSMLMMRFSTPERSTCTWLTARGGGGGGGGMVSNSQQ